MRPLPLVLLVAVLSACAGSSPTATRADAVVVYQSEAEIGGAFEIVEVLQPEARSGYGSPQASLRALRQRAARLGANGLLVVTDESAIADSRVRVAAQQDQGYSRIQYVAIYVPGRRATSGSAP